MQRNMSASDRSKRRKNIVKEFVIGFGFLSGIWLAIGINPKNIIFDFMRTNLENLHPSLKIIFIILPLVFLIGTIITLLSIYHKGGIAGAGVVVLGFVAGLSILHSPITAVIILIVAYILGLVVFRN